MDIIKSNKIKKGLCLIIVLVLSLSLCSCKKDDKIIEYGFETPTIGFLETEFMAYRCKDIEYDIDNIEIELFFGLKDASKVTLLEGYRERILLIIVNIPVFAGDDFYEKPMYFEENNGFYLIREIAQEEYYSDAYNCTVKNKTGCFFGGNVQFSHSEMVKVPKEVLDKEIGTIRFFLRIEVWKEEDSGELTFEGLSSFLNRKLFYTKLNNNKVELSGRM